MFQLLPGADCGKFLLANGEFILGIVMCAVVVVLSSELILGVEKDMAYAS